MFEFYLCINTCSSRALRGEYGVEKKRYFGRRRRRKEKEKCGEPGVVITEHEKKEEGEGIHT